MKRCIIIVIALFACSSVIAESPSADMSCGGYKPGGADCAGYLSSKAKNSAQKKMLSAYGKLLKALPEKSDSPDHLEKGNIVAFQKAWSRYSKEYCSLYATFKGGASSWQSANELECAEGAVVEQTKILNMILNCVNDGGCDLPSPTYSQE